MVVRRARGAATARIGDTIIASSERALIVEEVGHRAYAPVIYFPPGDVRGELLLPIEKTTRCPLKGTACYFDFSGDPPVAEVAWSYQKVLDFDPRLILLEYCVAFDRRRVTVDVQPQAQPALRENT